MAKDFGSMVSEAFGGTENVAAAASVESNSSAQTPAPAPQPKQATASIQTPEAQAPAAVEQPQAQPVAAEQVDPFLQIAQEFGFQGADTPESARQALIEDYRQRRELQSQYDAALQQAQQYTQFASEAQQWYEDPELRAAIDGKFYRRQPQASQQAPPQPSAPQSTDIRLDDIFQVPSMDTELIGRYRVQSVDANGQIVEKWRDDAPIGVRQQYEEAEAKRQAWANQLVRNPAAALQPALNRVAEIATQRALQQFEAAQQQREVEAKRARVQEAFQGVDNWVYRLDQSGRPLVNPATGGYMLSEAGAQAAKVVTELEQYGVRDPEKAWQMARAQTLVSHPQLAMQVLNLGGQVAPGAIARQQTAGEALLGGTATIPTPVAAATRQAPVNQVAKRQSDYLRQRSAATPPSRDGIEQPNGRAAGRASFGDAFFANLPANGG